MRYTVCKFCKKHNPKLFGPDSKITCYDDCCIDGNRFEPIDAAPKANNEEKININNLNSLEDLIRDAKIKNEIEKDPMKALIVCNNMDIISKKLIDGDLLGVYMKSWDKYNFDQLLSFTTILIELITNMEKTLNEVSTKDKPHAFGDLDSLLGKLFDSLSDLKEQLDESEDNKK